MPRGPAPREGALAEFDVPARASSTRRAFETRRLLAADLSSQALFDVRLDGIGRLAVGRKNLMPLSS
jgi:hypothetical protein